MATVVTGGGGGSSQETLRAVTGRSAPVALDFEADAGREVTIVVQASTDRADPDFRVVIGLVDFEDLEDTPISDLVLIGANRGSGQERNDFIPSETGTYTVFVEDAEVEDDATFSITITQRR
jgi:hypothetical protein